MYVSQSVSLLTSVLKLDKCLDIYSSGWDISLKFFGDIPGMLVHYFQIILNFLYVSQSVCLLTFILKLYKCRDIYSSGWDIFLKFFGDIPGMLVHQFQIIPNFLYVCQSVSWLTHLLKLDKYKDISSSGWDLIVNFLGDIPMIFLDYFKLLQIFCMSVSLLVGLLSYWN